MESYVCNQFRLSLGADGGTRTRTGFPPRDFKSLASTVSPRPRRRTTITRPRTDNNITPPATGRAAGIKQPAPLDNAIRIVSAYRAGSGVLIIAASSSTPKPTAPAAHRPKDRRASDRGFCWSPPCTRRRAAFAVLFLQVALEGKFRHDRVALREDVCRRQRQCGC